MKALTKCIPARLSVIPDYAPNSLRFYPEQWDNWCPGAIANLSAPNFAGYYFSSVTCPAKALTEYIQHTYPTYTTTRTTQSAPISEHNTVEGQVQAQSRRPTVTRNLVPQKPYQSNTRQGGFTSSEVVQFIVNGRAGIRLSDALEEKWEGLDGRDDRSPFAGNRSQVIIRLQVKYPPKKIIQA